MKLALYFTVFYIVIMIISIMIALSGNIVFAFVLAAGASALSAIVFLVNLWLSEYL